MRIIYWVLLILCLIGCSTPKTSYYSYKLNSYIIDSTSRRWLSTINVLSFDDYLFEFRMTQSLIGEMPNKPKFNGTQDAISLSIEINTKGVYLLQNKNLNYCELDSFAAQSKIVKTGKLWQKEFGYRFDSSDLMRHIPNPYLKPIDTLINNINCYYITIHKPNISAGDFKEIKIILVKKPRLNSLFKIGGSVFPDKDYCVVGMCGYNYSNKDGFVYEIDSLRPLTKKEINICQSIIAKTKTEIKNY